MANQIGLDAGLMSAAACGCWVGGGSMLGVACHDSHSGIDRVHTHTDHIWIMWWFHHLDPLGRSGHGEDIDHCSSTGFWMTE